MSIEKGKEVIRMEAEAIKALEERIGEEFQKAVEILLACKGRVIITGLGKSGIIGQKIASTLTSTGTAAIFLHAAEGLHGDLGAVLKDDAVICISKSGTTREILNLMPLFKHQKVKIISITGNMNSPMAKRSDVVLDAGVSSEACPFDLVPTSSTTATLVLGDALALALFQERGLSIEDFARYHPGGDIGKKYFLKIDDVMRTKSDIATVRDNTSIPATIIEITSKRLGATCILDENDTLVGIITDGDLRRQIEQQHDIWKLSAKDIMTPRPKCIKKGILAVEALYVMEKHSINQLIVVDKNKKVVGMVHIHDLLKAGLT